MSPARLALLDQSAPGPLGLVAWPYAAGVALWGLLLLARPGRTAEPAYPPGVPPP